MRKLTLELTAALALTVGAAAAFSANASPEAIAINGAYARASATPSARSGAVYFTVTSTGEGDRLIAASTPAAQSAMLHMTTSVNGVTSMEHVDSIAIPAGGRVELSPSGTHLMLMGLKAPLKMGGSIELTLTFQNAGKIDIEVPIGGVGQIGPPAD